LRRWLPSPEAVQSHRTLRWLRPLLSRPWLWHLDRRRVARGAAIGVFFGFLIPIAQILFSAIFALLLRANLPVAAIATLVSNPFTYAPIFLLAYQTGAAILGEPAYPSEVQAIEGARDPQDWLDRVRGIGKPLFLGLAIFALAGGTTTWLTVNLVWILYVRTKRRRRQRRPH
jgi:uncharacterized protein